MRRAGDALAGGDGIPPETFGYGGRPPYFVAHYEAVFPLRLQRFYFVPGIQRGYDQKLLPQLRRACA